ncbi:MAG: DEAD/DEAH box helicase [Deltaproteobacteria bacterium]|nr:DEAD/DEAH box helicase [Deltaproteobacteria bacterium]
MVAVPWQRETGLEAVVNRWLSRGIVREDIVAEKEYDPQSASYASFPERLPEGLREALRRKGIESLYTHQARAFDAALGGRHVVVSTPTASGKSMCFHLPVLSALSSDPRSRAMYLFPTKALARDQEASLRAFMRDAGVFEAGVGGAVVYDGDTPGDARRAARERCGIVLTNPDMLHSGILPHHAAWAATFQQLKYVVIDELHTYRGVFGSHLANVIRRLRRVCRFHGSDPVFICATATIGNPREHAARLLGERPEAITLVDESGAPRGSRRVLVYNPPVVNEELGIRGSCPKRAVRFAADLLKARVPTILFGGSRNGVEIMLKYLREATDGAGLPPNAIMGYRGGYLAETRRKIEEGLRSGEILGVVATNALELGVDIGELDAVVCAGYPGSIAATWQRFGRAGRRGSPSVAVLVASSAAIDQYLAREPQYLLGSPVEEARIDPNNIEILVQHLKCAAFEAPFEDGDTFGDLGPDATRDALRWLVENGVVHEVPGRGPSGRTRWHWTADVYPANHVPLRSVDWDNVVIIERRAEADDKTLAELDWRAAQTMLHEQAIYQHDGLQYQVERFDFENHKAYVRLVDPDYYTDAMTHTKVAVLEELASREPRAVGVDGVAVPVKHGEVQVIEKVVGYKKIKFHTHENVGYGDVRLPDLEMHTTSCWLVVPESLVLTLDEEGIGRAAVVDALRGVGRALETVATVALMCDPRDIAMSVEEKGTGEAMAEALVFSPSLHLYDAYPGGIGLSPRIFEQYPSLLSRARSLVAGCECSGGCPTCVGPTAPQPAYVRTRKDLSLRLCAAFLPRLDA